MIKYSVKQTVGLEIQQNEIVFEKILHLYATGKNIQIRYSYIPK